MTISVAELRVLSRRYAEKAERHRKAGRNELAHRAILASHCCLSAATSIEKFDEVEIAAILAGAFA